MPNIATSRILHQPDHARASSLPRPWIWPLPRLDGLAPRVLSPRVLSLTRDSVLDSVELGYLGRSSSPEFVPVLAARDGVVAYADGTGGSSLICLDHAGGWSTQYAGLAHLLAAPTDRFRRRRKTRVQAGDVLGHARRDALRVRFGLGRFTDGEWALVDPTEAMHTWALLPWFVEQTSSLALPRVA
jgi:murein DD-endopeptidase MepM/ murein hydrolase activator NlpD